MSALAAVFLGVIIFIYIELAIFTGCYMFIKVTGTEERKAFEKRQVIGYSILTGVFFPITFAIIAAYKVAERR